ncbi:MAG: organic hydroperoxide resistance protein [Chitinophagaceae bacterium]|nr:organic hydroperoxide resistance protein [Chitinophagaceae bacterium]
MEKVLYTASATATGGRNGSVKSSDGVLNLEVRMPKELGGSGGAYSNPEQLFAAGYSACFDSAVNHLAQLQKQTIQSTVTAQVGIGANTTGGFELSVKLHVDIKGLDQAAAEELVNKAHQVCPYSNATRNNIPVELSVTATV